jgi:hypothetical protein
VTTREGRLNPRALSAREGPWPPGLPMRWRMQDAGQGAPAAAKTNG